MPSGCKNWCWTLNNYTQAELTRLARLGEGLREQGILEYLVYGLEVGESGTPHLQGFVQFCSRKTMVAVKSCLQVDRLHLEQMKGTAQEASAYCKKDGQYFEYGVLVGKGRRRDLEKIKEEIDAGANLEDLWDSNFSTMLQYRKGFEAYIDLKRSKLHREPPRVIIYFGATGTGKTRRAWEVDPGSTWVYPGKGWFDGYQGQKVAIFDEFDGSDINFAWWKQLVDRYPVRVPVKGGFTPWYPNTIIFTSNLNPDLWWGLERLPMGWRDQFNRRVTEKVEMNEVIE